MEYDLELARLIEKIKTEKSKLVCVQLPAGLKEKAGEIQDSIHKETDARVIIWGGSCFGACDIPLQVERLGVDLLVQWGHTEWR